MLSHRQFRATLACQVDERDEGAADNKDWDLDHASQDPPRKLQAPLSVSDSISQPHQMESEQGRASDTPRLPQPCAAAEVPVTNPGTPLAANSFKGIGGDSFLRRQTPFLPAGAVGSDVHGDGEGSHLCEEVAGSGFGIRSLDPAPAETAAPDVAEAAR